MRLATKAPIMSDDPVISPFTIASSGNAPSPREVTTLLTYMARELAASVAMNPPFTSPYGGEGRHAEGSRRHDDPSEKPDDRPEAASSLAMYVSKVVTFRGLGALPLD